MKPSVKSVVDQIGDVLPHDEWDTSPSSTKLFASDVVYFREAPLGILRPKSVRSIEVVLRALSSIDVAIVIVGAKLSYSGATLPECCWIAVDMTALNEIVECNGFDGYVRVQAGCTWAKLRENLAPMGLRTPFWGPASGLNSTIGGAVGNDAVFFGSGKYGTFAQSVLGLTILLADGAKLYTGTHHNEGQTFSPSAPDATRLFVGSCGAFGVVLEVSMPLVSAPTDVSFAGFVSSNPVKALDALIGVGQESIASEALLVSPVHVRGTQPEGNEYSVSLAIEGRTNAEVGIALQKAVATCISSGLTAVGDGLLSEWRKDPFPSQDKLLYRDGLRWVPVHGMVPYSRLHEMVLDVTSFITNADVVVNGGPLRWTYSCVLAGRQGVLVEFNLFWRGHELPTDTHCEGDSLTLTTSGEHTAEVMELRDSIARQMSRHGSSHLQIGRLYPYCNQSNLASRRILVAIKRELDPRNQINPGVLGLSRNHVE